MSEGQLEENLNEYLRARINCSEAAKLANLRGNEQKYEELLNKEDDEGESILNLLVRQQKFAALPRIENNEFNIKNHLHFAIYQQASHFIQTGNATFKTQ